MPVDAGTYVAERDREYLPSKQRVAGSSPAIPTISPSKSTPLNRPLGGDTLPEKSGVSHNFGKTTASAPGEKPASLVPFSKAQAIAPKRVAPSIMVANLPLWRFSGKADAAQVAENTDPATVPGFVAGGPNNGCFDYSVPLGSIFSGSARV